MRKKEANIVRYEILNLTIILRLTVVVNNLNVKNKPSIIKLIKRLKLVGYPN